MLGFRTSAGCFDGFSATAVASSNVANDRLGSEIPAWQEYVQKFDDILAAEQIYFSKMYLAFTQQKEHGKHD